MDNTDNKKVIIVGDAQEAPANEYMEDEAIMLRKLKEHVKVEYCKDHFVLMVHSKVYDYVLGRLGREITRKKQQGKERLAKIIFLFANFTIPNLRTVTVKFTEQDMATMFGVSRRTIQYDIQRGKNWLFNVRSEDNIDSHNKREKAKKRQMYEGNNNDEDLPPYLPNKYELIMHNLLNGLDVFDDFSAKDFWVITNVKYEKLHCENYLKTIYKNFTANKLYKQQHLAFKARNEFSQQTDIQINNQIFDEDLKRNGKQSTDKQDTTTFVQYKHFHSPVYDQGFDTNNTPYPINWCLHPDEKARFIHGRWYLGVIHGTRRGKDRKDYLESIGLTHEIDMHNAMPYFMVALLPDTVSKADKEGYYELAKSGKLYEEVVEMFTDYLGESSSFAAETLKDIVIAPSRDYIKKGFQRHRNRKGEQKKGVAEVDVFFKERFRTIHKWMSKNKEIMQNRLAWIETDFVSYVGEKFSAENIRFDWLHDGVYVSEKDYPRAQEIWDSVRDEFEAVFMSK